MENGKYYIIWYKDDRGQTRNRGIKFIGATDIDVEYHNLKTGNKETIFIGTFTKGRGRSKEYPDRESILIELERMEEKKRIKKQNAERYNSRYQRKQF